MKVYKKLFSYVPDDMISGYLAIILSGVSAFLMVFGYYFIYRFLEEMIVDGNYENASYFSIRIVVYLTIGGLLYLLSGLLSQDRKSTRLNSSHANISYAVFCLKKKKKT